MTLHRKIKHNEKVCRAHDLGSYAQGQGRSQVNRLGGLSLPRKSVVRLTDRPDMTLDVYR